MLQPFENEFSSRGGVCALYVHFGREEQIRNIKEDRSGMNRRNSAIKTCAIERCSRRASSSSSLYTRPLRCRASSRESPAYSRIQISRYVHMYVCRGANKYKGAVHVVSFPFPLPPSLPPSLPSVPPSLPPSSLPPPRPPVLHASHLTSLTPVLSPISLSPPLETQI